MLRITSILFVLILISVSCTKSKKNSFNNPDGISKPQDTTVIGVWKRMSPNGPIKMTFTENGQVETDLGSDGIVEFVSTYKKVNDTIEFNDPKAKTCFEPGKYKIYHNGYTLSFDLVDDMCNNRIKSTMGFWVPVNHKKVMKNLSKSIKKTNDINEVLNRGRMYLSLGKSYEAKRDFDFYLKKDSLDPRVYINRAASRFPNGLRGVIEDCDKAIALNSKLKNAFFLRGLAHYSLGERKKACDDFNKSIELGFEILKEAEYNKCKSYW